MKKNLVKALIAVNLMKNLVKALIAAGSDKEHEDTWGWTPLMFVYLYHNSFIQIDILVYTGWFSLVPPNFSTEKKTCQAANHGLF